ncbi:acylphosphatase [Wenzhouxiangella sp. AB-CW3]|uniref:acylphosphatase n=1 Tax=Wenzhouxiangella sp. AB-CW3 TaxID=2771012 RepID=UPI00168BAD42|nr:acylphosphatase [Wenzhouxiangella sp. AB-CW3]QOC22992.1 acylphosphatase [Wenzhouxiangella sp. AB-CW3]
MADTETRCWLISGRVQGVFFRESTRRQAEPLGLSGHAVNLSDGRVEVLAHGRPPALDELEQWLHQGPPAARVDSVEPVAAGNGDNPNGAFRTG